MIKKFQSGKSVIVGLIVMFAACFCAVGSARADVQSGPTVNEKAPPLKVFDVTGEHEGKEVDYIAKRADKPTLVILIQAEFWSRPMARYLRALDKAMGEIEGENYCVAVWLTDDHDKSKEYLPRAQTSIKLQQSALTVFLGDKSAGPDSWGVSDRADLTAVIINKGKVTATFGYVSLNETDAPKVIEAFKEALKAK